MVFGLGLLFLLILNSAFLVQKKESTTIKPITETRTIVPDIVFKVYSHQDLLELERRVKNSAMQVEDLEKRHLELLRQFNIEAKSIQSFLVFAT